MENKKWVLKTYRVLGNGCQPFHPKYKGDDYLPGAKTAAQVILG
jgi:hypothetical protein